ncbi:MAG: M50 family metallopeptidase, partial [Zhenhengia sp.]
MSKIIMIVLMFALIILIHELGHFLAARFFKVRVNEFAIGMGPKLFSKQKGETLYSIRALPLGGFCSIEGESGDSYEENSMMTKQPWQKFIIFIAGAVMNFLLAWLIFTVIIGYLGYSTNEIRVVQEDLPAYEAGLEAGDRIIAVDGNKTEDLEDILNQVSDPHKSYAFTIEKSNGTKQDINLTPQIMEDNTAKFGFSTTSAHTNIGRMIVDGFKTNFVVVKQVFQSFIDLITGKLGADQLAGIVGVVQITSDVWNEGMKESF